jgi:hypothetical protein
MKKYILIIAVLFCVNAKAQTIDTVKHSVLVKPTVINSLQKDTIYQVKIERVWGGLYDTSITTYIVLYDRKAKKVGETNVTLPYSFLKAWKEPLVAYNFIITSLGLQKK